MKGIVIYCLLTFGISTVGFSCLCKNPDFPLKYLAQNDTLPINKKRFIVKGKVLSQFVNFHTKSWKGAAYNILVLEYWPNSSNLGDTITLIEDDLYCSPPMEKDSTYLIAAFSMGRYLGTSICEGTNLYSHYRNKIKLLGVGKKPEKKSEEINANELEPSSKEESNKNNYFLIVSLILGLSVLLNIYLSLRLLKKPK